MHCAVCNITSEKLQKCSRCKSHSYCGAECQKQDWAAHKLTCSDRVYIADSPYGKGLFASKDFNVGDELTRELPFFLMPDRDPVPKNFRDYQSLPPVLKAAFDAFPGVDNAPESSSDTDMARFMSIVRHAIPRDNDSGLCALASRANHSCKPNAHWCDRDDINRILLIADVPIKAGDEISVNYIQDVFKITRDRKTYIKSKFFFDCQCPWCSNVDPTVDRKLSEIGRMDKAVSMQSNMRQAVSMLKRIREMLEEIDFAVPRLMRRFSGDLNQTLAHIGDKKEAQKWYEISVKECLLARAGDTPFGADLTVNYLKDPEKLAKYMNGGMGLGGMPDIQTLLSQMGR